MYKTIMFVAAFIAIGGFFLVTVTRIRDVHESMRAILYMGSAWTEESTDDLQSLSERISSAASPMRITFITNDGLVIADSRVSAFTMENHFNRPEIRKATNGNVGSAIRHSDTEGILTIYMAERISDRLYLRVSYPLNEMTGMLLIYVLIAFVTFFLIFLIQKKQIDGFANSVVREFEIVKALLDGKKVDLDSVAFPESKGALRVIAYQVERLNADYRQVENALHLRRQFVANASHELKSPLTSIQGFAEMLYEGMEDGEEERETFLKCILNECAL